MIQLPTEVQPATMVAPASTVLFGAPKIGKTTVLTQLEGCLIIDTEQGTKYLSGLKVQAKGLPDMIAIYQSLVAEGAPKYRYIAIDVIDKLVEWVDADVVARHNAKETVKVANIGDIPYGAGWGQQRELVTKWLKAFQSVTEHLIIIGHQKRTVLVGTESVEFDASSLDLVGRLKNIVMSDADAIGHISRDDDGDLFVLFVHEGGVEAG